MFNEAILEMPFCQLNFGKNKLEFSPYWDELAANFYIWAQWTIFEKKKIQKIKILRSSWSVNTWLSFSSSEETDFDKKL